MSVVLRFARGPISGVVLLLASWACASDDLLVYSDRRNNGWQDWGWIPHYSTNAPVHSGSTAICVQPNGGWQAWWLEHDDLDTSLYTSLVFWIHGGPVGGQSVGVNALLDDSGDGLPRVSVGTGGKLVASTWQQITIPLSALGVANKTNFDGLQFWSNSGSVQPPFYIDDIILVAALPPAVVQISVNATQVVRTVDARIFGINTAAWDGELDTPSTFSVLNDMDNQALRWPGGSWGDIYHESAQPNIGWGSRTKDFMHVARNTGAQVYMIANYGSGTPQEAADWVRLCNITNGCAFRYWEVGNEVGGSWEEDNTTNAPYKPHDPWTYAMRFKDYYTQMKAVDPSIKIGAVADITEDGTANYSDHPVVNPRTLVTHNGWTPVMLTVMKTNGVIPDFLIEHKYAPNSGDTYDLLWSSTWATDAAGLRQMLSDYLGSAGDNVELECTEHGSAGDRQPTSLVGGLFYADSIGQILQTEFKSRLWWDLRNGRSRINDSDNALYGWRTDSSGYYYNDGGIVSGTAVPPDRYPTFYCAKLMKYFARGDDEVVAASSDSQWLSAYAVRRTNGALTLLVVNKSSSFALTGAVAIAGYVPGSPATLYSYGIPQDEAARTNGTAQAQDIASGTLASAGSAFNHSFPPYSATVLTLSPAAAPTLTAPRFSAGNFTFTFLSETGVTYFVEYKHELPGVEWQPVGQWVGTGLPLTVTNAAPTNVVGFYRVRSQ